ncbi:helix-turn-helix transcriptional regulator [Burkholderia pseudomultivorans]|uniref:AraC family transcriptional regulator n=1 Tax=Burkholderia pseudomultivorans TaxID=1207504 RepID=UPI0001FD923D|nr:helix-turn-helix transcriptional regulator [Burkholderia pseudomultivorans]EGD04758.1 AraC family transcriptional regulator [Burkholderia sp. TJI49]AOI88659.1 AraC family transcriptional regulator [Burkholderia pseudomultivorans]KVC26772.1 AraC family transcriptional regulator [Burkholderia pseudomultivorans]KVC30040.1 AraC family transcriptional regulator [Burkholderia pseudomultivorans]KVC46645.1 AraC family transcriptional regulator [Burkholderia pseudomultivorans]
MRNTLLDPYEHIPRSVVVIANDYAAGTTFPEHAHARGQFAFASRGTISVATPHGRWLVPPQRACWVPAGVRHEMTMSGPVTMLNTFVSDAAAREAGLPEHCGVYGVSALLRQLIDEAIDLPAMYDVDGRAGKLMALLVAEIAAMPRLSLHAPLPVDARLARICRHLFASPSIAADLDRVAADAGLSRRTFTRLFRAQTGVSFAAWRQQVCMLAAITRLSDGQPVTRVALDLGYASASAFASAFRRILGDTPSRYLEIRR